MPERVRTTFADNGAPRPSVSGQGTKRKRVGGGSAPSHRSSTDTVPVAAQNKQQNGSAQQIPSSPKHLSARQNRHAVADSDLNSRPTVQRSQKQHNGINAARERFASLADKRKELLTTRSKLPIWPHADKIRQSLRGARDVMLLVGETGISARPPQEARFLVQRQLLKTVRTRFLPDE